MCFNNYNFSIFEQTYIWIRDTISNTVIKLLLHLESTTPSALHDVQEQPTCELGGSHLVPYVGLTGRVLTHQHGTEVGRSIAFVHQDLHFDPYLLLQV